MLFLLTGLLHLLFHFCFSSMWSTRQDLYLPYYITPTVRSNLILTEPSNGWSQDRCPSWEGRWKFFLRSQLDSRLVLKYILAGPKILCGANKKKDSDDEIKPPTSRQWDKISVPLHQNRLSLSFNWKRVVVTLWVGMTKLTRVRWPTPVWDGFYLTRARVKAV